MTEAPPRPVPSDPDLRTRPMTDSDRTRASNICRVVQADILRHYLCPDPDGPYHDELVRAVLLLVAYGKTRPE